MSHDARGAEKPSAPDRIDSDPLVRRREPVRQGGRRYWICSHCERPPGAFARADVRHDAACPHR